jgi:hypothetical protein
MCFVGFTPNLPNLFGVKCFVVHEDLQFELIMNLFIRFLLLMALFQDMVNNNNPEMPNILCVKLIREYTK